MPVGRLNADQLECRTLVPILFGRISIHYGDFMGLSLTGENSCTVICLGNMFSDDNHLPRATLNHSGSPNKQYTSSLNFSVKFKKKLNLGHMDNIT